jgi:hypothetical protein
MMHLIAHELASIFGGPVAVEVPAKALGPRKSMVFGLIANASAVALHS